VRVNTVAFVNVPEVPVIVTVTIPVVAELLAVSVSVLEIAVELGLNAAVTPFGRPDADKLTLPLKPFCGLTVIVLVPLAPCLTVKLLGDTERVKFGGPVTVRVIVVVFVRLPDVPMMVTRTVLEVAALLAVSVSVLVPVAGSGLNNAVTPLGRPDADKFTLPLKPFDGVRVIVVVPGFPCEMLTLLGDAERV
jgi:hypothetical protein